MVRVQRAGIAFFSGALSLASQIVGLRLATQELSATSLTVAATLIAALLGQSVGALIFGRLADGVQHQDRLAIFGMATAALVTILTGAWGREIAHWVRSCELPMFAEAGCFMLGTVFPVNLLLGGILPALTRAASGNQAVNVQQAFGSNYGFETVGAATGSLLTTFIAIAWIGISFSSYLVASGALGWALIALLIIFAERGYAGINPRRTLNRSITEPNVQPSNCRQIKYRWALLVAALMSSCASLGMELIWQRYFTIVFGSDTHSYAIVAAVFLAGVSMGSLVAAKLLRNCNASLRLYTALQLLVAISILGSLWIFKWVFHADSIVIVVRWLDASPILMRLLLAGSVMFIPALLIGAALPVLAKIWVGDRTTIGTSTGQLYSTVFVGNILGVILCAVWLIPTLGLQATAIVLATICLMVGISLFILLETVFASDARKRMRRISLTLACIAFAGIATRLLVSPFQPGVGDQEAWVVDWYSEKASQTVAVVRSTSDTNRKRLLIDGVTIGEAGGGVDEKQQILANLPFLIGDGNRPRVLTIGLGTGILASRLAAVEQVESVTCVELSPLVIQAAHFFSNANDNILADKKFSLVHGDGVRYLRSADDRYDVIVSDGKSRPGSATNIPFFSKEYYLLCAESITENGVFVQWVSARCDRGELESILATFAGSFEFGHVAVAGPDSVYLIGSRRPIYFQPELMGKHLDSPTASDLALYGWSDADDFLSLYWLDQNVVRKELANTPVNTLDHPVLERFAWDSFHYSVSRASPQLSFLNDLVHADSDSLVNNIALNDLADSELRTQLTAARIAGRELLESNQLVLSQDVDWLDRAAGHCRTALRYLPNLSRQCRVAELYRELADETDDQSTEFSALLNVAELRCELPDDEFRMARILSRNQSHDLALDHYDRAVRLSGGQPEYRLSFGEGLLRSEKNVQALRQFEMVIDTIESAPKLASESELMLARTRLLQGVALIKIDRSEEGSELISNVLKSRPELQPILRSLINY